MKDEISVKGKYASDLDRLISIVTKDDEAGISEKEKKSLLYELEAEEIDLKKLEENA